MWEIFEKLCQERGVSVYRVCEETGIKSSAMSAWKKGKYNFKQEKLQLIADYFGVSVEYLRTGEEPNEGYYISPETARRAQIMYQRPELALLFEAAEDAPPEDIELAYQMLKALKAKEGK